MYVSPSALVLMHPDLFSERPRFGGFSVPCLDFKVKHDQLIMALSTVTYAYMEYENVIELRFRRMSRWSRAGRLLVLKKKNFNPRKYGYLSWKLARMQPGGWTYLYNVFYEDVKVDSPDKYMIFQVFEHDLAPLGFFLKGDIRKPICSKIMKLRPYAEKLAMFRREYARGYPDKYGMIISETKEALRDMEKEMEADYYD